MSGEEHGHPKKRSITLRPRSPENVPRAIQDQTSSSSDSQERRIREDPSNSLPPINDVSDEPSLPPNQEASEQPSRSSLHERHVSSQNGKPQDALLPERHGLHTAAPDSPQGSITLPRLSIDTRKVTAESSGVSDHGRIHPSRVSSRLVESMWKYIYMSEPGSV